MSFISWEDSWGRGQLSLESLSSLLQDEGASKVHMCTHALRDLCVCVGTYQVYVIFPFVIMASHFENACALPIEGRSKQYCLSDKVAVASH